MLKHLDIDFLSLYTVCIYRNGFLKNMKYF